jgi:hypothetical protein
MPLETTKRYFCQICVLWSIVIVFSLVYARFIKSIHSFLIVSSLITRYLPLWQGRPLFADYIRRLLELTTLKYS